MDRKIRVLLADDSEIIRRVVRSLLESDSDLEIAGETADASSIVSLTKETNPDILVMDLHMSGGTEARSTV
jgi:DNA-binding NarL/FixJ family response regulator